MIVFLAIAQIFATGFVLWHAICAINSMSHKTSHGVRAGMVLIATGCFFEIAQTAFFDHVPDVPETLTMLGVAIGTAYNRRSARCPCIMNGSLFCAKSRKSIPIQEASDEHRHA